MPKYPKFIKELLTNKHKLEKSSLVSLDENFSAIIQSMLPRKIKNPSCWYKDGKMMLRASDVQEIFDLSKAMKHSRKHNDTSYSINDIDLFICDCM